MKAKKLLLISIYLFTFYFFSSFLWTGGLVSELAAQNTRLVATYYGGTGEDRGNNVTTDLSNNVYLAGSTSSTSGIASGGFQNSIGGVQDAFLVKFDAAGTRVWATYYGGSSNEYGCSVATDAFGNVYLAGYTSSVSGIASGGYDNTYGGGGNFDAFLVKFDAVTGNRLWATYYGGIETDYGFNIITDAGGNVYLAGATDTPSGIASGGFQNGYGGGTGLTPSDAFLVKFSPGGNRLWATYYGGTGNDSGRGVAIDMTTGDVYLTGYTASAAGIVSGGFQNIYGGGVYDAFLVKFAASGTHLWSTYYGGLGIDQGYNVTTYGSSSVYLAGITRSLTGIASGGFQNTHGGGNDDAFLVKFDAATGTRLWATYYGGASEEECYSVITDPTGSADVYLAGDTYSPNTGNCIAFGGFQNNFVGTENEFLVKFNSSGNRLCATYYGQSHDEDGHVAVDGLGNVYLAGWTPSPSGIASGGFQVAFGGGSADAYLVKFTTCSSILSATAISTNILCKGQCNGTATANPGGGTSPYTYSWNSGSQTLQTISGLCAGTYTVLVTDAIGGTVTASVVITEPLLLTISTPTLVNVACNSLCTGSAMVNASGGTSAYTYSWNTGPVQTTFTATGLCAGTFTCVVTDANGCDTSLAVTITQPAPLTASVTSAATTCGQNNGAATVSATGGTGAFTYTWNPAAAGQTSPTATGLSATSYTITIRDANGCSQTQTVTITPSSGPSLSLTAQSNVLCNGDSNGTATVTASAGIAPYTYSWSPATVGQNTAAVSGLAAGSYTCTIIDSNNCTNFTTVEIKDTCPCPDNLNLFLPNAFSPNNDGQNDEFCLQGSREYCIEKLEIAIYNRWGEKIYSDYDVRLFCWNGTYNDKLQNTAVFVYHLEVTLISQKTITKKGNISLIR